MHIGNRVKINAFVYICNGVTIEDGVMIGAGVIFTNDRYPRATTPDLRQAATSEPDEHTLPTLVREGATIGAASTIGMRPGDRTLRHGGNGVGSDRLGARLCTGGRATRPGACGYVCRCGDPLLRSYHAAPLVVGRTALCSLRAVLTTWYNESSRN